jgi:AbrB family looped-hinge helix DNA binding protein
MRESRRQDGAPRGESRGFAVVDEKGRFTLPKSVRKELGIDAGSAVAWVVTDGVVVLMSQEQHLNDLFTRAHETLETTGMTTEDVMALLPEARTHTLEATYSRAFLEELAEAQRALDPVDLSQIDGRRE